MIAPDASKLVDLYLRLSVDRDGKDALERQEEDLRKWAESQNLTVRKVWSDSVSGYQKNVVREDFQQAVAAVSSGEVGTLAVWKLDRLSRRGAGQVGLVLDDVEEAGSRVFFLRDNLDSSVQGHRMMIVFVSEQARAESANTSLRVRAKIASDAAKGIPSKTVRPFGWETDMITLRPSEADLVREAVEDLLAGRRSMLRISRDWTAAGVLTDGMKRKRRGKDGVKRDAKPRWTATSVRQLLLRKRNAGILIHQGAEMEVSQIQPIIMLEQMEELEARINANGIPVGERAKSLLGGIIRCECGSVMHRTVSYSQRKGGLRHVYQMYQCAEKLYDKTQKHASINAELAENLFQGQVMLDLFVGASDTPEDTQKTTNLKAVSARLRTISDDLTQAGTLLLDSSLKSVHGQARARIKVLEVERAEAEQERDALLADQVGSGAMDAFLAEWRDGAMGHESNEDRIAWEEKFHAAWEGLGLDGQRALIRARFQPWVKRGGRGVGRIQLH